MNNYHLQYNLVVANLYQKLSFEENNIQAILASKLKLIEHVIVGLKLVSR